MGESACVGDFGDLPGVQCVDGLYGKRHSTGEKGGTVKRILMAVLIVALVVGTAWVFRPQSQLEQIWAADKIIVRSRNYQE